MFTIGQQICDGMLVVVSVDDPGKIIAVVPADKSWFGEPFTVTFDPGVSEKLIMDLAARLTGG